MRGEQVEAYAVHETQPARVIHGYKRAGLLLRRCARLYNPTELSSVPGLSELLNRALGPQKNFKSASRLPARGRSPLAKVGTSNKQGAGALLRRSPTRISHLHRVHSVTRSLISFLNSLSGSIDTWSRLLRDSTRETHNECRPVGLRQVVKGKARGIWPCQN